MLPASIDLLLKIAGILISAILAIQPWFIASGSDDLYLYHSWVILAVGSIVICILSVIFLFFRPRAGQTPFTKAFLLLFATICLATFYSDFINSLQQSILLVTLLMIVAFLRVTRKRESNLVIAATISLSGFSLAIYSLFQHLGMSLPVTSTSLGNMSGIFAQTSQLAAYLMMTSIITLGLVFNGKSMTRIVRFIFASFFLAQLVVILISLNFYAISGIAIGIVLFLTSFWEKRPGKILRYSPFISGIIMALFITGIHGVIYYSTVNYPWGDLAQSPTEHLPAISTLLTWQMAYGLFLSQPFTGFGPGAIPYLMPMQRPPLATSLGLQIFNDDPYSSAIAILAETGLFGLIAVCTILAIIFGCYTWKRSKDSSTNKTGRTVTTQETDQAPIVAHQDSLCMYGVLAALAGSLLLYSAGAVSPQTLVLIIPGIISAFCIYYTIIVPVPGDHDFEIEKATMIAIIVFAIHSLFNNNLTVPPLITIFALILSLHFSACLRNIVWKKKISLISVLYLLFPAAYVFSAYNVQIAWHKEQMNLFEGTEAYSNKYYEQSQKHFERAIQINPQSLRGLYGLALTLEKQGNLDQSHDILTKLDTLSPNVFNTRFEIARIMFERQRILEAHRYALKSLEWNQVPRIYELLGQILLKEGKLSDAEKVFEEGLILIPEHRLEERLSADRIRLSLAALAATRGNFARCTTYLAQINSTVNEKIDAIYLNGLILSRQNKHTQALELFEQALKREPQNPRLMNAVGFSLAQLDQDIEKAQELLETAYQMIKRNNQPMLSELLMVAHSLGIVYHKQGKRSEAEHLLTLAFEETPAEWGDLRSKRLEDLKAFYIAINDIESLMKLDPTTIRD